MSFMVIGHGRLRKIPVLKIASMSPSSSYITRMASPGITSLPVKFSWR